MSNTKIKETKTETDHPLEEFFDIEEGSTEVVEYERETDLVKADDYDEKDNEIEQDFQEIYDRAMEGYDVLADEIEDVDARFKARIGEVSLQHLNVALNAAKNKASMKEHKDKLKAKENSGGGSTTVNNTLVVDRNTLLKELMEAKEKKKAEAIEVEVEEVKDDE